MPDPQPLFLSVVMVVRDQAAALPELLAGASRAAATVAADFELIVVDNASRDGSVAALKRLAEPDGLPNLQVLALTGSVDVDTAAWAGLEHALGDFIAVADPRADDLAMLGPMLEHATTRSDVVFATNRARPAPGLAYRLAAWAFAVIYRWSAGVDVVNDSPRFRVLSRRVVNFVLQHPQPAVAYRFLPVIAGFTRSNLDYDTVPAVIERRRLRDSIEQGITLLTSTTRAPMRIVTGLSLFGALANVVYSGYVIAVALLKDDVAEGWVTLSLQQSGMFLLLSLVLLVLGEYMLRVATLSNEGPPYHVAQEFTSARMVRAERLNVVVPDRGPDLTAN